MLRSRTDNVLTTSQDALAEPRAARSGPAPRLRSSASRSPGQRTGHADCVARCRGGSTAEEGAFTQRRALRVRAGTCGRGAPTHAEAGGAPPWAGRARPCGAPPASPPPGPPRAPPGARLRTPAPMGATPSLSRFNSATRPTHLLQASETFRLQEEKGEGHQHKQAKVGEERSEVPQTCRGDTRRRRVRLRRAAWRWPRRSQRHIAPAKQNVTLESRLTNALHLEITVVASSF